MTISHVTGDDKSDHSEPDLSMATDRDQRDWLHHGAIIRLFIGLLLHVPNVLSAPRILLFWAWSAVRYRLCLSRKVTYCFQ